jgi:hypothetical protein
MEMLLFSDRRAERRAVFVDCQVVREEPFELVGDCAIDLSTHGMLLLSSARVRLGEELVVSFRVPGEGRYVDTLAMVTRVVRGARRNDRGPAVGLMFHSLSSDDNARIRWALRRFPPTLPARAPRIDYAATASLIALSDF